MMAEKGLMTKVEVGHGNFLAPVPAIVGPLLGLVYVIALPLVAIALLLGTGYLAARKLATRWHHATQATG